MNPPKMINLADVESILACLPGVQKVRVVVNDWGAIEEIHILTGLDRAPKQIVRDVQSALKAQWDIKVDHRKISVAQLKASGPPPLGRLRYTGLEIKADVKTGKTEACVTLERDRETQTALFIGKAQASGTEDSLLFALASAVCTAVNLTIKPPSEFFVDDVNVIDIGRKQAVTVLLGLITPKQDCERLLGAALIRQGPREACVRAALSALNRRLEVLPQNS